MSAGTKRNDCGSYKPLVTNAPIQKCTHLHQGCLVVRGRHGGGPALCLDLLAQLYRGEDVVVADSFCAVAPRSVGVEERGGHAEARGIVDALSKTTKCVH